MKTTSGIVIIGAGNTGCAAAKLLADKCSVTVLEAGFDQTDDPDIVIPSRNGNLVLDRTNEYFAGLGHATTDVPNPPAYRRFPAIAGLLPGGGSSVNGMQQVQGTAAYYAMLAQLLNDPEWGAANVSEVFKRIQTFNGVADYDPAAHGYSGPLDVKQVVLNLQAAELFSSTTATVEGVPENIDYNDFANPIGTFRYWQVTETPQSTRAEAYSAYLKAGLVQSKDDPNVYIATDTRYPLQVVMRAHLQKIHFDPCASKPRAVGVTVAVGGVCTRFNASRYVILSTGFQTSSILQCSGVGDAGLLSSLGIDVVVDNPNVGQHMVNHPLITLTGLVDSTKPNPFTPLPADYDPQGLYSGGAVLPDGTGERIYELIGIASPTIAGVAPVAFTIAGLDLAAKSEGQIKIYDKDINRMPNYDFRYLSDPSDVASMIDLYTKEYNILTAMGLLPQGPDPVADPAGVENYIRTKFSPAYHWTGMNRMATSSADGVVASDGRVFGTQNLYVADVTIMPRNPLGNTQAMAYLAGNIIADKLSRKIDRCGCGY